MSGFGYTYASTRPQFMPAAATIVLSAVASAISAPAPIASLVPQPIAAH